MKADLRYTERPFTVAVCSACGTDQNSTLMPALRETVRNCPHAVLVATQCLLGQLTCATSNHKRGVVLLVQPCTVDRVPTSSVQWIGPVTTDADVTAACRWIANGVWDRNGLPMSLRADLHLTRANRLN
ncbi:hypothetical protein ACN27E_21035 [Mycobacterium sp. WMMD1722]|uniref:hypothetical protein n=1 Tax=Mycobacterium sp. WMMD1722 TaxID=3404117 RepID=UPI003BF4DC7F